MRTRLERTLKNLESEKYVFRILVSIDTEKKYIKLFKKE